MAPEAEAAVDAEPDTVRRYAEQEFPGVLAATARGELAFDLEELSEGSDDDDIDPSASVERTRLILDPEGAETAHYEEESPDVDIEDDDKPRRRPALDSVSDRGAGDEVSRLREEREILLRHLQHANRRLQARVETQWQELREQSQRLAAANRAKDLLLARTSHDVRNGVGVVLAYSSLLAPEVSDGAQDHLRAVEQACRHLVELLDDLVDEATLASGSWVMRPEAFRLDELLDSVVVQLRDGPYRRKLQQLEIDRVGQEEFLVLADRKRIGQVIRNYIDNASKYSMPRTVVRVRLEQVEGESRLEVLDEGPGIPVGAEKRLFEPSADIGNRPTAGEKSTGVGLSLVADVIRRHGGRVWGENRAEGGARFGFSLPETGPPASTSEQGSGIVPRPLKPNG